MDAYCRTCSGVGDTRVFNLSTVSQISSVRIEDMLIYCTQLEVTPEDNLPQQICFNCFMSLNSAFEFRKLCYKSDNAFRETLQTTLQEMEIVPKLDVNQITDQCPAGVMIKQECLELDEFTISIIGDIENCSDSNDFPTHDQMQNEARKKYSCEKCDFTTDSANIFKRHKNRKHPVQIRKTDNVGPDSLKACSQVKRMRTIYKCGECFFQNYSVTKLRIHQASKGHTKLTTYRGVLPLRRFDERKAYTCPHCGARFGYKENVNKHIQVACRAFHNNALKIEESAIRNDQLASSIKTPDEIKFRIEYRCSKCKQSFVARSAYVRHKKQNECPSASSKKQDNLLPYRCDFCNYKSSRRLNLYRHQIARCKEGVYLDETLEPQNILGDTLTKVYSDSKAIEGLKLESGEPIFPTEYLTDEYDNIGTYRPPIKLIDSVEEFQYFLVIKMRGLRCCACSVFFLDKASLDEHRRTVHLSSVCKTFNETTQICENCRLPFYRSDGFNYHRQLELINRLLFCTTCEVMVIGNTAWLAHCNTHHGKRNLDDSYEKVFIGEKFRCCNCYVLKATLEALESHQMEEHFPERLKDQGAVEYECDKCFRPFATIDQWERHMEVRTAKKFYRCGICHMEFLLEKDAIAHQDSNDKCKVVSKKNL
ncbi:zinc finger protein 62-like [Ochlerotatus camptorhynchus]|uniref:zinc finger protein 62-like n=1 Tax=Ochlerotatus camptorhynchus TaxID=644619 RepID=UPI0031D5521C